jgi:hypothetical protein
LTPHSSLDCNVSPLSIQRSANRNDAFVSQSTNYRGKGTAANSFSREHPGKCEAMAISTPPRSVVDPEGSNPFKKKREKQMPSKKQ